MAACQVFQPDLTILKYALGYEFIRALVIIATFGRTLLEGIRKTQGNNFAR